MNKKLFYFAIFLIFILFISGCDSLISEEDQVKNVINQYYSFISEQNMLKALSCCADNSDAYADTKQLKSLLYSFYGTCDTITLNFFADINNVSINGDDAQVQLHVYGEISACTLNNSEEEDIVCTLKKEGSDWKLFSGDYLLSN